MFCNEIMKQNQFKNDIKTNKLIVNGIESILQVIL